MNDYTTLISNQYISTNGLPRKVVSLPKVTMETNTLSHSGVIHRLSMATSLPTTPTATMP